MKKSSFLQEFKSFAVKGNVIDMAVGVIIGSAFGKIVTSLVNDIIMPPIGWLIGGINFRDLKYEMPLNPLNEAGQTATINYGMFLQNLFDFLIISLSVFLMLRILMKFTRKRAVEVEKEEPAPEPSEEVKLLREIRDALKK